MNKATLASVFVAAILGIALLETFLRSVSPEPKSSHRIDSRHAAGLASR